MIVVLHGQSGCMRARAGSNDNIGGSEAVKYLRHVMVKLDLVVVSIAYS